MGVLGSRLRVSASCDRQGQYRRWNFSGVCLENGCFLQWSLCSRGSVWCEELNYAHRMVVPIWYIRDRCPEYAFLSPRSQQNWLLFLSAEFRSTRELTARDCSSSVRVGSGTNGQDAQSTTRRTYATVGTQTTELEDPSVQGGLEAPLVP